VLHTTEHLDDNSSAVESDTDAEDDVPPTTFRASAGWCARFKRRNCFVSRRQTSSRQFRADAPAICADIRHVQSLIDLHNDRYTAWHTRLGNF
jgi:Tc5 transposase DNA-binding domain